MATVIILGAGVAGLSAAWELLRRGQRVIVLEARQRCGGRIHTIQEPGLPIELGAEFIHGCAKPLWSAIEHGRLATHEVPARNQFYDKGRLHPVELWDKVGEAFSAVRPRERDLSVREFVAQSSLDEFTRQLVLAFVEGFDAADPDRISAHALLRAEYAAEHMSGSQQFRLNDGYGALIDFLAAQVRLLGGTIQTGAAVRRVRWRRGYVEALYERNGVDEAVAGDAAVVTLPLGVLKARVVEFTPALAEKEQAVADLEFGNVLKIALVFSEPWWAGGNFGFVHAFAERIPTWWSDPRGPVLTGWAGGPKANGLRNLARRDLENVALEIITRILGADFAQVCPLLRKSYCHDWAADPFARGAYSFIPVNGLDLPRTLAAPAGGALFFAGEATVFDAQLGTVFGAFETGLRAAAELVAEVQ